MSVFQSIRLVLESFGMTTEITTEFSGGTCILTMRPPEGKPPTLDYQTITAFEHALEEVESRAHELASMVVQSASPKFFCAGANINVIERMDSQSIVPWVQGGHSLMNRIEALPIPVVARVEGFAMGGGLELAMACDVIFASSRARFAQSEVKLGLVTGWGGCWRLARRVGLSRAKELCFSGRMFDAEEAMRLGVIEWQGAPDALERHLEEFLNAVAGNGRTAVKETKRMLAACARSSLEEYAAIEAEASQRCLNDGESRERLAAFLSKKSGPATAPRTNTPVA